MSLDEMIRDEREEAEGRARDEIIEPIIASDFTQEAITMIFKYREFLGI